MQEEHKDQTPAQPELSEIWQELSGKLPVDAHSGLPAGEPTPPALESDPWSALLQSKGTEVIDLQQLHLPVSDQELERMLQIMQEQPAQKPGAGGDSAPDHQ